jgi:uncharacterized protein (DUF1330 family)
VKPPADRVDALARTGRIALVDLVRSPSHEARLAFPSVMQNVLERSGGRVAWSGSIDQQLIGHGSEHFHDLLVSEFPNREACIRAIAERAAWAPEHFVSELKTYVSAPWPSIGKWGSRALFGLLGLRGGGPPPYSPETDVRPALDDMGIGAPEVGPNADQLEQLIDAASDEPVVMANFLQFRSEARYDPAHAQEMHGERSGAAAYQAYGKNTVPLIGRVGGRIRWSGQRAQLLSEGPEERWAGITLVQYPSRLAFLGMLRSPEYHRAGHHRDAGLDRSDLLVCTSHAAFY